MKPGLFKFLSIIFIISCILSIGLDSLLNKILLEKLNPYHQESYFILFFTLTFLPMVIFSLPKNKELKFIYDEIPEKFEKIYIKLSEEYSHQFQSISNKLKILNLLMNSLIITSIILFIIEIITILTINEVRHLSWYFLAACILIIFIISFKKEPLKTAYTKLYKEKIIPKLLENTNLNFNYIYEKDENKNKFYEDEYYNSSFNSSNIDKFYVNCYLEGHTKDNLYMRMAELHLLNKMSKNSYLTIFNGLFVSTNLSKYSTTLLKISLNNDFAINSKTQLEMDSSKFENYFDIYTENKFESMKILTHDVMEKLVNFYEKHNIPFEIVIKNNKIYLRFFTKDLFTPKKIDGILSKNDLLEFYFILQFIIDVTSEINSIILEKNV